VKYKIVSVVALIGVLVAFGFLNFHYLEVIKSSRDSGYQLGYSDGFYEGNTMGFADGYLQGFRSGENTGYDRGLLEGNITGFADGYLQGFRSGENTGYDRGLLEGNITGFADGYLQGIIDGVGSGFNIRDPTYAEALKFIATDKTNENQYSQDYTCFHFVADFKENAFQNGYRCGFVYVEFPSSAHAIICFNTINHGLIFIEPQDDSIVILIIGEPYWDRSLYEPSYDDTIVSFAIIW